MTWIQDLLGHRRLNSTLVYARVHTHTVATDYCTAVVGLERGLDLTLGTNDTARPVNADGRPEALPFSVT